MQISIFAPLFNRKHNEFVLWCNGSTTVFGSVCLSSNLGRTTREALKENIFRGFFFRDSEVVVFVYPYKIEVYRGQSENPVDMLNSHCQFA